MKNTLLLLLTLFTFSSLLFSQPYKMKRGERRHMSKIEELEKLKLIEILDMDEETTLRFFTRKKDHQKVNRAILMRIDSLIMTFKNELMNDEISDDKIFDLKVNKILELESEMLEKRKKFIYSLNDILTSEQIARLVVFEFRFRSEIRDIIFKERQFRKKQ